MDIDYVRWSPDLEVRQPDEARLTDEIVSQMGAANLAAFDRHRHAIRDAHAKSHGFLKGRLRVHDDLPAHLRQGIFAEPATYDVIARLSSAPGDIHSDEVPAPRGFAIKILDVPGARLAGEEPGRNQDFLMVNFPVLAFGTVQKYKKMLGLLEKNANAPDFFQRMVAAAARGAEDVVEVFGREPGATLQGLARDNANLLGETYHTQGALRFGDYIGKISLAPASKNVRALTGRIIKDVDFSAMRDMVVDFFRDQGAEYTLRVQLATDLDRMPIENAAVQWDEESSPQQSLASLSFEAQDAFSPARRVYGDDVLHFNPWHCVEAHQPLGSINRIRRAAYAASMLRRHELNAVERHEPATLDEIPD